MGAAFVGWLVAVSGVHFPGLCSFSEGVSFEDLSKLAPLEQWSALPALGKQQIIAAIGIIEHQSEWKIKPHYMKEGGAPGSLKGLGFAPTFPVIAPMTTRPATLMSAADKLEG